MKGVVGVMVLVLALAACSPEKLATDVTRRTAKTVVLPVVRDVAPPPADTLATECILANASNAELNDLARNVGNEAGTHHRGTPLDPRLHGGQGSFAAGAVACPASACGSA
jgi:hypothetical protein